MIVTNLFYNINLVRLQSFSFITKLIHHVDLVYFTTWVPDTSYTSVTQTTWVQHESDTANASAKQMTRMRHECYTNNTNATRVKKFDLDNNTSENIFSHPYISYKAKGSNFVLRTTFWKWLVHMLKCLW